MLGGTITASGANAHGVDATYGGAVTLSNVNVTTYGASSSAIATDFGGGTVKVTGGTIYASNTTAGSHSAAIYSTGTITVNNATATSMADCGGVIDGANSIILTNTALTGLVEGFKLWKTAPASGAATVKMSGGSLTVTAGDGFYVTGTAGNAALGNNQRHWRSHHQRQHRQYPQRGQFERRELHGQRRHAHRQSLSPTAPAP